MRKLRFTLLILLSAMLLLVLVFGGCAWLRGPARSPEPEDAPERVSEAPPLQAVHFLDDENGWAAGQGVILATTDGGNTWLRRYSGEADLEALDFVDPSTGWAHGEDALLRTADAGQTWEALELPGAGKLQAIDFVDIRNGWAVAGNTLFETQTGGESWTEAEAPVSPSSACRPFGALGWVASGKEVYRTQTGSMTWLKSLTAPLPGDGWVPALSCSNSTVLVVFLRTGAAGKQAYAAFLTRDEGNTWAPLLQGTSLSTNESPKQQTEVADFHPEAFQVVDRNVAHVLGSCPACDGTISLTSTADGGKTWTHHNINELQGATDAGLWFRDAARGWIVGTRDEKGGQQGDEQGIILRTEDGGKTWTKLLPK